MNLYYNPLDKNCKLPLGAIMEGENSHITITASASDIKLFIRNDKTGDLLILEGEKFNDKFKFQLNNLKVGLYWYVFEIDGYVYGRDDDLNLILEDNFKWYQLIVYDKSYKVPNWFKGGIIYQIFPDRFCKDGKTPKLEKGKVLRNWGEQPYYKPNKEGKMLNNDFFGGNFKGIESKLSYLKDLGVTAIYLNPITASYSNHRYDTSDYLKIDSLLGDDSDFKRLTDNAKSLDITIILDGVYNHTGDDSVYFNKYGNYDTIGAYQSKNSPYYDWYIFEKFPNKYKCWWDILILPTINKNSAQFEDFITGDGGVLEKYLNLGAGGFRLDVVDELPSRFVKKIRNKIKSQNENSILIGEVWEDATNKIAYDTRKEYFLGLELDSVMNYPLKNAIIDYVLNKNSLGLKRTVIEQINNYPKQALDSLMNILDTHDTARILTVLGRDKIPKNRNEMALSTLSERQLEIAKKRLFISAILQFTLYGVPSIYYGDEVGLQGESDPFNRACYPWGNEDKEIYSFYKKITQIRRDNNIFIDGDVEIITADNGLFSFKRVKGNEELYVAVNVSEYKYDILLNNNATELFSGQVDKKFTIEKFGFKIIKSNEATL